MILRRFLAVPGVRSGNHVLLGNRTTDQNILLGWVVCVGWLPNLWGGVFLFFGRRHGLGKRQFPVGQVVAVCTITKQKY